MNSMASKPASQKTAPEPFALPRWRWTDEVKWALALLGVLTVFRLWYCTYPDVIADEAYYWLWSRHFDASYYSKGPGVAWTIAFGTAVFGDNVFGIRWISVVLAAGTGWLLFTLARRLFDDRTAWIALAVTALVPLFALGSVLMTIDPLSVFFWALAANFFCDAIGKDRYRDWALLGLAVGLGFLAKYVNALQLLGFIGYLAWSPAQRKHLRNPKALLTLTVFLLCTIPVVSWNAHHGWITATHLKERGALQHAFHVSYKPFLDFITMQAVVISPLLFIGVLVSVFATIFKKDKTDGERYALCLLLPIFVFYAVLAVNNRGEANWTATGYIGALILLAADWRGRWARLGKWKWAVVSALVLAVAETVLLHETGPLGLPAKKDPLTRARGWSDFGQKVERYRKKHEPDLLIGNRYQTAALMAWYLPGHPQTFVPHSDRIENQFSFWPGYKVERGTKALFVTDETDRIPDSIKEEFPSIEKVGEFWTEWRGRQVKPYYVYQCVAVPPNVISAEEMEIIEVVLQAEFGKPENKDKSIVIEEGISSAGLGGGMHEEQHINRYILLLEKAGAPGGILWDLENKCVQPGNFSKELFKNERTICISESDEDVILKESQRAAKGQRVNFWPYFYQHYPNSVGLVTVSRVGFSDDRQWALVGFSVMSGDTEGRGCSYVLHQEKGHWVSRTQE
jgi:hypothetical protein